MMPNTETTHPVKRQRARWVILHPVRMLLAVVLVTSAAGAHAIVCLLIRIRTLLKTQENVTIPRGRLLLLSASMLLWSCSPAASGTSLEAGSAPEEVTFVDAALEAAIRESIAKPEGPIHPSDLDELQVLSAPSSGIADLAGLQYCTSLIRLHLDENQIRDISPLASLTNLTDLSLNLNRIDDISPLASLTNLTVLRLFDNDMDDISPLASLVNLTDLVLSLNKIDDISTLTALNDLARLYLMKNKVRDVSALASLASLTHLGLAANEITDISPLVVNGELSAEDTVNLTANPLDDSSVNVHIPALRERGVTVSW